MGASLLNQSNKTRDILKWIFLVLAVGWAIFLIINGAIPGDKSAAESNGVAQTAADIINTISPQTITSSNFSDFAYMIRKVCGHFLAFTLDGILFSLTFYFFTINRIYYKHYLCILLSLSPGIVVAAISEVLQIFAGGRTASFADIGIDFGGYSAGVLLVFLIIFFTKNLEPRYQINSLRFNRNNK